MVFSILLFLTLTTVHSHSEYRDKVPNGKNSPGNCYAWGHTNNCGSGQNQGNSQGNGVLAGATWSISTCKADPDGDEYTNGEELGNACCYGWEVNANSDNVDTSKGVTSAGPSDGRISNPRIIGSTPVWLASDLFGGDGDIKKYHTAQPGAFTITTATRSVRKQKELKKKR